MSTEDQKIVDELAAQFGEEGIAEIPAQSSEQLPKMTAAFKIDSAYLNRSQMSGRKQLTITTVIVESDAGDEFVDRTYKKNWGLETAENFMWLKKDMSSLELEEPRKPEAILRLCQQLPGICFNGQLVPNADDAFPPNCYINKGARRHELEGGEVAVTGTGAAGSSNI